MQLLQGWCKAPVGTASAWGQLEDSPGGPVGDGGSPWETAGWTAWGSLGQPWHSLGAALGLGTSLGDGLGAAWGGLGQPWHSLGTAPGFGGQRWDSSADSLGTALGQLGWLG
jgi:hypothetical protein